MSREKVSPGRLSIGFVIVLALFAAAPTVGDVGACGTAVEPLDAGAFFKQRLDDECRRCDECGYASRTCKRACDKTVPIPTTFPPGCHPVVHDGEVCLRAIEALGCDAFGELVSNVPIVPTECDFCPVNDVEGGF